MAATPALDFVLFHVADLGSALAFFSEKLGCARVLDEDAPGFHFLRGGHGVDFGLDLLLAHWRYAGGRDTVSDLSWQVFDENRRASARIVRRTSDLAAARLALLGVDATDPAQRDEVERLLGTSVAAGLTSNQPPTARTLQTWLDAIDALGDERTTR